MIIPSSKTHRSPLTRYALGLVGGLGAILGLLLGLNGCRRGGGPAVGVTTEEERRLLLSVACECECGQTQVPVRNSTVRATSWMDERQLRKTLKSLRSRNEARPALSEETIVDFIRKTHAEELALQAPVGFSYACSRVRFVSPDEMKGPDMHEVMALSRVGFNRLGNQALVVVSRYQMGSPGGRGSSEMLVFLTKPADIWVRVGWVGGPRV